MSNSQNRPNLVFIFADQWRRQAVGFMKDEEVYTPNMDKFAEEGMIFNNALSCFPLCSPHRASLMSGKFPLSLGMFTNCKVGCDAMLKPEEICIGDVLKESGYDTGYIGKWHLDLPELNLTDKPESGASGWDAYTEPGPKRHGFDFWHSYGAWDEHLHPHYWQDNPQKIHIDKWSPEYETDVALDYIKNHGKDNPFALVISWNPPHSPYDQVPEKYRKLYEDKEIKFRPNVKFDELCCHTGEELKGGKERVVENIKNYYAAISGLDDNFKRILDTLKEQGLDENTIVVLSSDHGDMMASHGLMAKHVWYEESIGIPFAIRWPNKIKQGTESNTLLNSPDVMPTLLGLMGIDIPNTVEGIDVSKSMLGEEVKVKSAYIGCCPGRDVFLEAFEKAGKNPREYGWRGVRTETHTYVVHKGYWPEETKVEKILYDNVKDPYQMNPIYIEDLNENELAKDLHKELEMWLEKVEDPFKL